MSKETLQHTMKSKVRVFEDGSIRLLRKGQKGLIHAIFSRFGLVLVLLVLQFGALFSLMRWFSNLLPHYLGGTLLVTAAMMVYRKMYWVALSSWGSSAANLASPLGK